MPDLKSLDVVYLILAFVVPGLIIVFVRAQFTTGRIAPPKEAALAYLALSAIYYALVLPGVGAMIAMSPGYGRAFAWVALAFVGPAIMGALLGLNARHGFSRRMLWVLRLPVIHAIPTAWDWKFSGASPQWVLVTLKDGTRFAGFLGARSFASSDPMERDIYIEKIYDLSDDDKWVDRGDRGVIVASEIQTVSFWPEKEGEGG